MRKQNIFTILFAVFAALALIACGGGGGGSSGSSGGSGGGGGTAKAAVMSGTMTKGSVIVNGVEFTVASGASIRIDDNPGRPETELKDGMQVHVKGTVNDDGVTGTADTIEAENEVQGNVTAKDTTANPDTLTVAGQKVIVDDSTVFANGLLADIVAGTTEVEVHGQRDDMGNIIATRVELKNEFADDGVNLRGMIGNLTATTFTIGTQVVNFATATIEPAGMTLVNGELVEVEGSLAGGVITAAKVQFEDEEDAEFVPAENEDFEIEGFIAGFTAHPGTFNVGTVSVTTTSATEFSSGSSIDLANGVSVEVDGTMNGGSFQAREIKFKKKVVRITTDNLDLTGLPGQIIMMGKTVTINDMTKDTSFTGTEACVQMRGFVDSSGNIIASEIKDDGNSCKDTLQAEVEAKDATNLTLTMLGITADLSGAAVQFSLDEDSSITTAQSFFAAITAKSGTTGGTLVKVKGAFSTPPAGILVEEAELEN
ncbi:MAG: hypothetical protein HZB61_07900 [Nitrospirae bacterium]|nr:hypothetical protein [Nitrospirota bacterium]